MGFKPWHKLGVLVVLSAACVGCTNGPQKDKTIGSTYGNPPNGKSQSAQAPFPTRPLDNASINGQPKLPPINGPTNTVSQPGPAPFNVPTGASVPPNNAPFNVPPIPSPAPPGNSNSINGSFAPAGGFGADRNLPPPVPVAPPPPNFNR